MDTQQALVYRWEEEFPLWNVKCLDEADCVRTIEWGCNTYKVPIPKISFHSNRKGYSWSQDLPQYQISLQTNGMNVATCLHEVAHLIHGYMTGHSQVSGHEAHGPEWLALYCQLLIRSGIISRRALECSLRDIGLKWVDPSGVLSPRRIRKTYRKLYLKEQQRQKKKS